MILDEQPTFKGSSKMPFASAKSTFAEGLASFLGGLTPFASAKSTFAEGLASFLGGLTPFASAKDAFCLAF